jgi:putative transposon-encoded protein
MKKIQIKKNELTLKDNSIVDFFEKEVTPHGTGAKIPCSSRYIGKKAYVIITENEKEKKKSKKNNRKD